MFASLPSWITIAAMFACPFFCLGQGAVAWGSAFCSAGVRAVDGAAGIPCCCDDRLRDEEKPASDPCQPVDSEPDCLCHGAVVSAVGAKTCTVTLESPPSLLESAAGDVFAPANLSSRGTAFLHAGCHFPQAETGRQICARASRLVI